MSCAIPKNAILPPNADGWVKNTTILTTPEQAAGSTPAWFYGVPVPAEFL